MADIKALAEELVNLTGDHIEVVFLPDSMPLGTKIH